MDIRGFGSCSTLRMGQGGQQPDRSDGLKVLEMQVEVLITPDLRPGTTGMVMTLRAT